MNKILQTIISTLIKKPKTDPKNLIAKKPDEDFIPYVCHYDPNTILTKNGELMQIIRITGFSNASVVSELISLRDTVRDAIKDHVKSNHFALWFTTIRRKKNISPKGQFEDFFAQKINEEWVKENEWDDQYVNELYITVIIEGLDTSIVNFKSFLRSFSYGAISKLHKNSLEIAHKKLAEVVGELLKETVDYGGKLIGIKDWDGVLYSEPMRFFGKIVNLYEDRFPLAANDISNEMATHKVAFGDRDLEVVGNHNKNFAAMFSLKEYFEVSTEALDLVLQLPFEFIITQSFDFAFTKKDLEPYEYQNYILQVSGDEEFRQESGIASFIENKNDLATDYGKQQITLMIISKAQEELEKDVKLAFEQFNALGFVVVREDIFAEHCFWAQLPANFSFLRRQRIINSNRIAGFAALHNFPSGSIEGNYWGPAVCILKTVLNTPYFFNFHDGSLGHTLILGEKGHNRTELLNFLLLHSRKFKNKLVYFDFENSAKPFIRALSGQYYDLANHDVKDPQFLQLNPLALPHNSETKKFLVDFFTSLVVFSKEPISQNELQLIPEIIDRIITSNAADFKSACEAFNNSQTPTIYSRLKIWNGESLSHIFGSKNEINWAENIMAFDLTEVHAQRPILIPIMVYLLHRIEMSLDGKPAILVLNEAWDLCDNIILAPHITEFLQRMRQKNCVVILTSSDGEEVAKSKISAEIAANIATQIFLPESNPNQAYKDIFNVTEDEMEIIKMMEFDEKHFMVKHASDSLIASLRFDEMEDLAKILVADNLVLTAMDEVIAANTIKGQPAPNPKLWIPQLVEILKVIKQEKISTEKEKLRLEAIEKNKRMREHNSE